VPSLESATAVLHKKTCCVKPRFSPAMDRNIS
jgi:hypothetical protein